MKKFLDQFNSLNDQTRYGIFAGVVLLIFLLDVFFLVLPQIGSICDVNDQIKKLSDDTQQVLLDRARINALRKNLKEARLQLKDINRKVRPIQEVPAVLSIISNIANEYGVKIDQLVPEKDQQESLKDTSDGKYDALPVIIRARSGYHNFGRFLDKLEKADLFFMVKDFIIQNDDRDLQRHLYSLTAKILLVDRPASQSKSL
jgi:Tfp pilus assembly protein PilO